MLKKKKRLSEGEKTHELKGSQPPLEMRLIGKFASVSKMVDRTRAGGAERGGSGPRKDLGGKCSEGFHLRGVEGKPEK